MASELSVSSRVSYYGHKFATGVFGMCLVVLTTVLVSSLAKSKIRRRVPTVATALLACLASIALLEIDGYVGPFANAKSVTLATGLSSHRVIDAASVGSGEAENLIASAQFAQDRPTSGTRWAYIDPGARLDCILADEWFFALSDERMITKYGEWWQFPCESGDLAATYFESNFPDP